MKTYLAVMEWNFHLGRANGVEQ